MREATVVLFPMHWLSSNPNKTGDYYNEINGKNYICWLKEKLILNLEPNSVLVTDNAPYYNIQKNEAPTSNQIRKQ
jgi:hypothetical protein